MSTTVFAQVQTADTTALTEVVVISSSKVYAPKQPKALSSLDEYLERSSKITLIKRGAYAWEPMINGMTSERLNITIDGMHIFGACTDKMDPVTSYVDVSNLQEINIASGQSGTSTGPSIGGALDLVRTSHDFCDQGLSGSADVGVESNGNRITTGGKLKYVTQRFFGDVNAMFRNSENYKAGNGKTVEYSQFSKYNASANVGWKINEKHILSGSVIFDNATNVGYPALPMDVSLARAVITNLRHTIFHVSKFIEEWDTKVYFNTVKHVMDDTKRPTVPIHMDMPGWSDTYGLYSKLSAKKNKHTIQLFANAYYNRSIAEMTMYPEDKSAPEMFMYTWPDVRTTYAGISGSDKFQLCNNKILQLNFNAGYHKNRVADEFGLNSLKIFYPEMSSSKIRIPYGLQSAIIVSEGPFEFTAGVGYGERVPSVSEGYGFYLFNSFDKYDYIGNPKLQNEKSLEGNIGVTFKTKKVKTKVSANRFLINDYIIGVYHPEYSPMTLGANGLRIYSALKYATLFNTDLSVDYRVAKSLNTRLLLSYSRGKDHHQHNLPLIKPFSYRINTMYNYKRLSIEAAVEGACKQKEYSKEYGEDKTPAYTIVHLYAGYTFSFEKKKIYLRAGIENITDKYYSTYADWNNLAQRGRNVFMSVSYIFSQKHS